MKKLFLFIVFVSVLFSCKKENNLEVFGNKINKKIDEVAWFLGSWENNTREMNFREIWTKENDSLYKVHSFITIKNDTVFNENVALLERNDSLFYIVSVKNQNNEKPVSFYMSSFKNDEITFENPTHDFPNKIIYKKINPDSIVATIVGVQKGNPVSEDFPMKKSKN